METKPEQNLRTPSLREKVLKYEELFHLIQLNYAVTMDSARVKAYLDNIAEWSYAHRRGNGEYSEKEQRELINAQFHKLTLIQTKVPHDAMG